MEHLGTLYPVQPYRFQLTCDLLRRYAHPAVDVTHDGAYWRVLRQGETLALLRVTGDAALEVTLAAATGAVDADDLLRQIGHILGVESDPAPFYAIARQDAALWAVVQPLQGLRWLRTATVFEALMMTITEQQIAWTAAQRAQRWLVEWVGAAVEYGGRVYHAFPTPAQIAAASVDDLKPMKITFKRMHVMIEIAGRVAAGALDLEVLRGATPEHAYKMLIDLKGIGHWTAVWTLQRTFGGHAYIGQNDVALQAAVNHYFYGGQGRIPEAQVLQTFEPYGEYGGLAANYTLMRWVLDRYEAKE